MNVTNTAARDDILSRPLNEKKQLLRSFIIKKRVRIQFRLYISSS